ncbi:hypothetical protein CTheo_7572 [Ceratobasidium theobromae]|uniref:Uncharacterized protein n=1 Tax=Ceratobasidium theobromae TaxID=1582974 RepID=A0A5N5QBH2_9AGAM|nr:hypothetical protein CTheo_7572 [Ceratobasidium theobromae]
MDHVELEPSLPFSPCDSDPPSFFNNAYDHEPDNQQNNLRRSGNDCISLDGVVAAVRRVDVSRTVENLSEDLISIGKYFDEIYTSIGLLRKNWLHYLVALGSGKDTIQDCLNSWDAIRKAYDGLLWQSREQAADAASNSRHYRMTLFPLLMGDQLTFEQKKVTLTKFKTRVDKATEKAKLLSQGFLSISGRIKDFQARFVALLVNGEQEELKKRIALLNTQIGELKKKIERYSIEYNMVLETLYHGTMKNRGEVLNRLLGAIGSFLGPIGQASLVLSALRDVKDGMKLAKTRTLIRDAYTNLRKKEAELKKLEGSQAYLREVIDGSVMCAFSRTNETCMRLDAIGQLWAVIRTETQLVEAAMSLAGSAPFQPVFESTLKNGVTECYQKLEEVLLAYANRVIS